MNLKRPYTSDWEPPYLYEVVILSGSRHYRVVKGMMLSVIRKPGLLPGRYEFRYAERTKSGTLLLTVEGPDSRIVSQRRVKLIRESDIKQIHLGKRTRE